VQRRRAAARAKYEARKKEEAAAAVVVEEEEEEEDEEESTEWETDSEDEAPEAVTRLKPKFVPKSQRVTIQEQERLEEEAAQAEAAEAEKKKQRALESRSMVETILKKEEEAEEDLSDEEMPDDDDEIDEDKEYDTWKLREAMRVKNDRYERERAAKEAAETLRRRNLSDAEREAEDKAEEEKAKAEGKVQDKKKWKYLQKYYHKGAFFQDTNKFGVSEYDELFNRDYGGETLDDKFNKEAMPKVLQVKKFGHAGRTKYTHLIDQDTSAKDDAWNSHTKSRDNYTKSMGGMGSTLERPGKKQKRHD